MMTKQGEAAQEALFDLNANHEGADALRDAKWIRDQAERVIADQVEHLRSIDTPWSVIGLILGVSKQAAHERYGRG